MEFCIEKCSIENAKRELVKRKELQIAVKINHKGTSYIKPKIDYAQQNVECRLCGDEDETTRNYVRD